jgi:uncharacterized protein YbjT (DUF2867 family)
MIAVTAATGQLEQLVIKSLLKNIDPRKIFTIARNKEKSSILEKKEFRYALQIIKIGSLSKAY